MSGRLFDGFGAEERAYWHLHNFARPQYGVDAMRDDFAGTTPIPGVRDVDD